MPKHDNEDESSKGPSPVTTRPVKVRLNELCLDSELYFHDKVVASSDPRVAHPAANEEVQGHHARPEFFIDDQGRKVVIKGFDLIQKARDLAAMNAPGYAEDMEIDTFEVIGATLDDVFHHVLGGQLRPQEVERRGADPGEGDAHPQWDPSGKVRFVTDEGGNQRKEATAN